MNKKFSTLMATLFVAGALTTANAVDLKTLADNGKYYYVNQTGQNSGTAWGATSAGYRLGLDADSKAVITPNVGDTTRWTVVSKLIAGVPYFQLKNANGKVFTCVYKDLDGKEAKIDWFKSEYDGTDFENNTLSFMVKKADGTDEKEFFVGMDKERASDPVYLDVTASDIAVANVNKPRAFDLTEVEDVINLSADEMNNVLKGGFQLQLTSKGKEYKNLQGNVFTGKLKAIPATKTSTVGSYYFYRPSDEKYIVLTDKVWSDNTANLDGKEESEYRGYKFEAISKHAFAQLTDGDKIAKAEFQAYKSNLYNDNDSLIVTMPKANFDATADSFALKLFVSNVDKNNYVTVIEADAANDKLTGDGINAPYIKFGASDMVSIEEFAGKAWNITRKSDGNVLSPNFRTLIDGTSYEFIPAAQVELAMPEGQWLPVLTENGAAYFVNRESEASFWLWDYDVRRTATDTYKYYWTVNGEEYSEVIIIKEAANAELGKTEKGYASYDEAVEALNGKYLTLTEAVTGSKVYVGKDADDNVILTADQTAAIEFRVKQMRHDYTSHDGLAGIDTLQHYTTYLGFDKDGNLKSDCADTLQFYHYSLYEQFSEKYLYYNSEAKKFELSDWTYNANEDFDAANYSSYYAFVLKNKGVETFNALRAYEVRYDYDSEGDHSVADADFDNYLETNVGYADKMYGAFQTATLADMDNIYNYNDNDRFALTTVATPEYQSFDAFKNIKVARQADKSVVMYEQGKFLGMENINDPKFADIKAAMYVDTAYVRKNTYRPQYLLALEANHIDKVNCGIKDHGMVHPDTTYGRFLVNLVDSIATHKGSDKSNPYLHEGYKKLGFVEGFHTGDSLFITQKGVKTGSKIYLGKNEDCVSTFAFRYVDNAREGVKMETKAYTDNVGNPVRGWVKWHNGVPVVTTSYNEAEVFVANATDEIATDNEAIETTEVSIIASSGAVIINNAAGKAVAISNILGQTIANTVITSDNATIAVPAGIVVVSVEGEAAVKAIVK